MKAKSDASKIDVKDYANSARASVGSLSTKLEERRKKFREMRSKAVDLDLEKNVNKSKDEVKEEKAEEE